MIGAITFIIGLIYVPQCGVQIYADNATPLSLGLGVVMIFIACRFK
jgi:hypothetical protein